MLSSKPEQPRETLRGVVVADGQAVWAFSCWLQAPGRDSLYSYKVPRQAQTQARVRPLQMSVNSPLGLWQGLQGLGEAMASSFCSMNFWIWVHLTKGKG